ncbi:MAG: PQQ-dependent sugar dehydrogenase [Sumerlaeia bacterium]
MKLQTTLLTTAALVLVTTAQAQVNRTLVATVNFPVAITSAGDDRLFITEKLGRIRVVDESGNLLPTPFLDIDARASGTQFDERGLLSTAFHPNYATNGFFYVNYTNNSGSTVISRFSRSASNPNLADSTSEQILLTIPQDFSNHNGGQIQFGPDGMLYVGMGDGGSAGDPNCRAQSRNSLLGKMLRLDVNQNFNTAPYFGIPADNPFIGEGNPMDKVWGLGLRNPWRFSFDRTNGDLWIADVGQDQLEEVNHVPFSEGGGQNFGWKIMEGQNCYTGTSSLPDADCPVLPICNDASLTLPVTQYNHSFGRQSITGGYVYRGPSAPSLLGKYVFADYVTGEIFVFDSSLTDNPATTNVDERITVLEDTPEFVTTFGEDNLGNLYVAVGNSVYLLSEPPASTVNGWTIY